MKHGCPTVCANVASLPEVVGDAAYLVDPFDVESIAEGICTVLHDDLLRASLINNGRIQAEKYSWENTTKSFLEVIRKSCI